MLLGAVPFPKDVPKLKELGVGGVITLNEPFETLVPTSMYKVSSLSSFMLFNLYAIYSYALDVIQQSTLQKCVISYL